MLASRFALLAPVVLAASLLVPSASHGSADGVWYPITPLARIRGATIYDPVGQRLIVIGGRGYHGANYNDAFALDVGATGSKWSRLDQPGSNLPFLGFGAGVGYDSELHRIVTVDWSGDAVVGAAPLSGVFQWSPIVVAGTPPPARTSGSWAMDTARNRLLLFGGSSTLQDLWALQLGAAPRWERIDAMGPPSAREDAPMIYDPVRDQLVLYGGQRGSTPLYDLWVLSLDGSELQWQWQADYVHPTSGVGYRALYDSRGDRMVLLGPSSWAVALSEPPPNWYDLPRGPNLHENLVAGLDEIRGRAILLGGGSDYGLPVGDEHALDLATTTWSYLEDIGSRMFAGERLVFDPVRNRLLLGATAGLEVETGHWQPLEGSASYRSNCWYDPASDRLVWYGNTSASSPYQLRELRLSGDHAWRQIPYQGGEQPSSSLVLDTRRQRILGIIDGLGVWQLAIDGTGVWGPLATSNEGPPNNVTVLATYDVVHDSYIAVSYVYNNQIRDYEITPWALSLANPPTWTQLLPKFSTSLLPVSIAYDPVRQRALMFGGRDPGTFVDTYSNIVRVLELAGTPSWHTLTPAGPLPRPRSCPAVYDPARDGLVIAGGVDYTEQFGDAWELVFGTPPAAHCGKDIPLLPGSLTAVSFEIENTHPYPQTVDYELRTARAWPGLPQTGSTVVGPKETATVSLDVPVPDSAAGGAIQLEFAALFKETGVRSACSARLFDVATPTLVALVRADTEAGRVRLEWFGSAVEGRLIVERREREADWREVGEARETSPHTYVWEDADIVAGRAYDYRVRWGSGSPQYSEVTHVETGARPQLALAIASANPGHDLSVRFSLPGSVAARLDVYDVAGRRIHTRDVRALGTGEHVQTIAGLPSGVYLVALSAAGRTLHARAAIVR